MRTATSIHSKMLWSKWVEATTTHPVKIRMPSTTGIAGGVATTGEPEQTGSYNHRDLSRRWPQDWLSHWQHTLHAHLRWQKNIFAVAELLNKHGGDPFSIPVANPPGLTTPLLKMV
jgi:hypothetical protein